MDNKKINKYIIVKAMFNLVIIIIGAFLVSSFLAGVQNETITKRVENESFQILEQVSETLNKNREDVDKLTDIYHQLNKSTVEDLKELFLSGLFDNLDRVSASERTKIFKDVVDRSNAPYLFMMDNQGQVVLSPVDDMFLTKLDETGLMTKENLASLTKGENDINYVKEDNYTGSYYFYSTPITKDYYLVLGTDATILETQFASLKDVTRIIKNVVVAENGFLFAVDKNNKSFIYYNDNDIDLSGLNALDYGLSEDALKDKYAGRENINGTDYYCVSKDCGDYTVIVAANDINDINSTGSYALAWSTAGFVIISLLCLIYASIVRDDYLYNEKEAKKFKVFTYKTHEVSFNFTIFKKMLPVLIMGAILMFGISYYSYTLLEINNAITDASVNINELENNFADANQTEKIVSEYYGNQFLGKAKIIAYLIEENPEALNSGKNKQYYIYDSDNNRIALKDDEGNMLRACSESSILESYCQKNQIDTIYIYDTQGRNIATNSSNWYFQLSFNQDDQSYPFRDILDGKIDYYIQDAGKDELGNNSQYIGTSFVYYTTKDTNGKTKYVSRYDYENYISGKWNGSPVSKHESLLQIGLNTQIMSSVMESTNYEYLIKKSTVNNAFLVLFDDSEQHNILYSPKASSIGKSASDIGLNNNAFNGNYIGIQRANGVSYLLDIQYYEGYYIGTAILKDSLFTNRTRIAGITSLNGLFFILLMSLLITLSTVKEEEIYSEYAEKVNDLSDQVMFFISTPTGNKSVTEKAASRWDNKNIPWSEKTSEQKLVRIIMIILSAVVIYILAATTLVGRGMINNTIVSYIISGNWDKGLNIFALSACGLVLVLIVVIVELLNIPIRLVTSIFGTKSETVGHLLASVIKYSSSIFGLFYCLYLLGFNSTSLLTSAGILSLVVGLGSQSLIKDVVAGIFIIFEGEFRVGDIVTIGGYRGQVLDVGLRTTKIMAADHNIKIINNNDVNGVINMTRVSSLCSIEAPVAYGNSINEIEEILNKELPLVKDKVKGIIDGPYYKGVIKFDQKAITLQISALCKEKDILEVRSGLNREVLDIIYRYGLNEVKK